MAKEPSAETQLRTARSELKRARASIEAKDYRVRVVENERDHFRSRATKAEQEVAEWKRRFDLLLERTPKESADG